MLSLSSKVFCRCQKLSACRILTLRNYATFGVKDILYETSDETGTLLTRFAKHVALERQKICEQVPSKVKYSDYFPLSNLKYFQNELYKTENEQISTVITYAFTYRSNADPAKFAVILNELDKYAVGNIEKMSADTILRTLYAFLFLMPNWMTRLDFYHHAMIRLNEEFNKHEVKSKEYFLQLCFYMGLAKKQKYYNDINGLFQSLLDSHLDQYINKMSTLDIALVCNAAYKTSIVIKSDEFNQRLLREVLDISNISNGNDAFLVTFIKSMRLQRLQSTKVCEYIENICQDSGKLGQLQARGQVHLFAYLAENLWDSKECTLPLIETITEKIKNTRNSDVSYSHSIRGKDISTFLWSCAQLNCSLSTAQLVTIENSLLEKVSDGAFKTFPDQLIECCLSLWILGHKSKELLEASVKLKSQWSSNRKQPKVDSRLTVLLSAVKIEEPAWCTGLVKNFEAFNSQAKVPQYLLNNEVIPYQKVINDLIKEELVSSADLSCPINGINIPGVRVVLPSTNSEVFLEFVTPAQTLHFSKKPVAILRLKLRLLESLGHQVKLMPSTDVLSPQSLRDALYDSDEPDGNMEPSKTSIKA